MAIGLTTAATDPSRVRTVERMPMAARSAARRFGLRVALPVAGWVASIGGMLLFGLPPLAAVAFLLLATSPAFFAPTDRDQ